MDMQVPVTIFDIVGAAQYRNEPVHAVYGKYYFVGILPREGLDWLRSVSLKLKKPCPFLVQQRCTVYEVRPLSCILFPEYQALDRTLKTLAVQDEYKDYLCLRQPFTVSRERARALRTLARMLQRELLVSDSYLFDRSPFWVNYRSVLETFEHARPEDPLGNHESKSPATNIISFETQDQLFRNTFAKCHPFSDLSARIGRLDQQDQQAKIFSRLSDKSLWKSLWRENGERPLTFSFSFREGKLEARRESLAPREHMFL